MSLPRLLQAQRQSGVETTREGINSPLQALQGAFALQDNRFERASKVVPFDNLSIESKGQALPIKLPPSGAIAATVVQVLPNRSLVIKVKSASP